MGSLIDLAIRNNRVVIFTLAFIFIVGTVTYLKMPRESEPDVAIPMIYVSISHEGISPEDAERLLIRPMEKELRTIEGIKELRGIASEGHASIILEFDAGFKSDNAMRDVVQKVNIAKSKLPANTDEPLVNEINVALFPILIITLYGDVPERTLLNVARQLKDAVEAIPEVLKAEIGGDREEVVDILVDPLHIESYQLSYEEIYQFFSRNNILVAAGALDNGQGRFNVKVPGVFENVLDILELPIKVRDQRVVMLKDIAQVRRTFKDPTTFARVNGKPALTLEISKRVGTNIISTIEQVQSVVTEAKKLIPDNIHVGFIQDKSEDVRNILNDLQNNVLSAVVLLFIVVVAALGFRSAALVSLAIPGSFLLGILVLAYLGLTLNIVVLFSLILASGMLVDGAVIVTEYADRKMLEGMSNVAAYSLAAKRMALPIIGSTLTTLAVFMPLLYWPGVLGQFMKYLPITVIATLTASIIMALIFIPTLGALFGKPSPIELPNHDTAPLESIHGITGLYVRLLSSVLHYPVLVLILALGLLVGVNIIYAEYGKGVEFFPKVEPNNALLHVRTRGDLSVYERQKLVNEVEQRILAMRELKSVYSLSGILSQDDIPEDTIGVIQLEFMDWQARRPASEILREVRERTKDLAGVFIEVRKQEGGPVQGKPIQIQVSAQLPELLQPTVAKLVAGLQQIKGLIDIEDSRPLPGIDWKMQVNRAQASRFGADISSIGSAVQLVTNGIMVGEYRPDDADKEVELHVRFPPEYRYLEQLQQLRINTSQGIVPLSLFVQRVAEPRTGTLKRSDERRILSVMSNVEEGVLVDDKVKEIQAWLATVQLDPRVTLTFKGEEKEQREAQTFLGNAFGISLFLVAIILVGQFNSFYQTLLILSAVVLSTIGVLLGLLITGQPFGIVMCGIGLIALAGVVVNNNIVLIDTFNGLRAEGVAPHEAVLRTCAQRLRPVFLTTATTILGLVPMALSMNIDLFNREITFGAPSTQWWTQLSISIAGGLTFATLLTLIVTPCLLVLGSGKVKKQG
jgi:multidrug efflux pump